MKAGKAGKILKNSNLFTKLKNDDHVIPSYWDPVYTDIVFRLLETKYYIFFDEDRSTFYWVAPGDVIKAEYGFSGDYFYYVRFEEVFDRLTSEEKLALTFNFDEIYRFKIETSKFNTHTLK